MPEQSEAIGGREADPARDVRYLLGITLATASNRAARANAANSLRGLRWQRAGG